MRCEDVQSLIKRIPPVDISKVVLVMKSSISINIDLVYKLEPDYIVVRGREAGTNDDGRGFFVPYDEIAYMKIERYVKVSDLKSLFGEPVLEGDEASMESEPPKTASPAGTNTPAPVSVGNQPPQDPASIAKQNLLERIRATRTSVGVPRSK